MNLSYILALIIAVIGFVILTATTIPFLGGLLIGLALSVAFYAGRQYEREN